MKYPLVMAEISLGNDCVKTIMLMRNIKNNHAYAKHKRVSSINLHALHGITFNLMVAQTKELSSKSFTWCNISTREVLSTQGINLRKYQGSRAPLVFRVGGQLPPSPPGSYGPECMQCIICMISLGRHPYSYTILL